MAAGGRKRTAYGRAGFSAFTSPKAQVLAVMWTVIGVDCGTLTATGTKPEPQQLPAKMAVAISVAFWASTMRNSGDLPHGCQSMYSSPAAPK